jgi:O-antigen/teichoic acid export membrane protein
MQSFSLGAGLAALAFWGFIASVVVAGIWYDIRKREAQHETVRRLVESGQSIDEQLMDKLLSLSSGDSDRLDRAFKITGLIMLPAAVGLALFGLILGKQYPDTQLPLLGVSVLVGCIGLGFMVAAKIARRWYLADDDSTFNQS